MASISFHVAGHNRSTHISSIIHHYLHSNAHQFQHSQFLETLLPRQLFIDSVTDYFGLWSRCKYWHFRQKTTLKGNRVLVNRPYQLLRSFALTQYAHICLWSRLHFPTCLFNNHQYITHYTFHPTTKYNICGVPFNNHFRGIVLRHLNKIKDNSSVS